MSGSKNLLEKETMFMSKNNTKRSLLASVFALVLCCVIRLIVKS